MSKVHVPKHAMKLFLLIKKIWHVERTIRSWDSKYQPECDLCGALTDNELMECSAETVTW